LRGLPDAGHAISFMSAPCGESTAILPAVKRVRVRVWPIHDIVLLRVNPPCCNTIARLLDSMTPLPTSRVYAIPQTILVIPISCKGQVRVSPS